MVAQGTSEIGPEVPLKSFYLANTCKLYVLFCNRSVFLLIGKQYLISSHTCKILYAQGEGLCVSSCFKDVPTTRPSVMHFTFQCPFPAVVREADITMSLLRV